MNAGTTKPEVVCQSGRHIGCLHDRVRSPAQERGPKAPRPRAKR